MKLDSLIAAAKEYRQLQELQSQIRELGRNSLAKKFGYTPHKISMIANGKRHKDVSQEDFDLIRKCQAEHNCLVKLKAGDTRAKIAKRHGISNEAVTYGLEYI